MTAFDRGITRKDDENVFHGMLWFIDPLVGSLLTPTGYDFIKKLKVTYAV
jgi:hypothetical protein